jgi:hypothetical protein
MIVTDLSPERQAVPIVLVSPTPTVGTAYQFAATGKALKSVMAI